MGDDQKHMDTARRLARHAAEREWLNQAYEQLARQQRVWNALESALSCYVPADDKTPDVIVGLKLHCARVMVAQCESIMRRSGLTDLDRSDWGDTPGGVQAEAR